MSNNKIKKTILNIIKNNNITNGTYVDCDTKTIYIIQKSFFGKINISTKPYPFLNIIKQNNVCNYFTFREHIHDIKSLINSVYGMISIMEYDFNAINDSDVNGYDIVMGKEILRDIIESTETLTDFTTNSVKQYEESFGGIHNLSDLLIYYLPTYVNTFLIDESMNNEYDNCYGLIKTILDKIKNKKLTLLY